jgi:hypothetical protein
VRFTDAVHQRQALGIENCMRLRQLFLRHAHLLVICMMRPKHCLAIRDQFKHHGCCHRRVCERRLEVLLLVVRDIRLDCAFSLLALGRLGAGCL